MVSSISNYPMVFLYRFHATGTAPGRLNALLAECLARLTDDEMKIEISVVQKKSRPKNRSTL
jgi:hypothetical protein